MKALFSVAQAFLGERNWEEGLKHLEEAHSLIKPEYDADTLVAQLSLHALVLEGAESYEEALLIRKQAIVVSLRIDSDRMDFAECRLDIAKLYAKLKQFSLAVDWAAKAVEIRQEALGDSHPSTRDALSLFTLYYRALPDPKKKKELASKSHRLCNYLECTKVEKKMGICLHCNSYYLCKDHRDLIAEHMCVCPNHPDALWVERKLDKVVKCRRCRKESKLLKCSVCGEVAYCGGKCQNEDWKRHKLFCKRE